MAQGRFPVEGHMGGVTAVVPGRKTVIFSLKACHYPQPSARPEHLVKSGKLFSRPVEMLNGFRAGDKIVRLLQYGVVWIKKRIKETHAMTSLG